VSNWPIDKWLPERRAGVRGSRFRVTAQLIPAPTLAPQLHATPTLSVVAALDGASPRCRKHAPQPVVTESGDALCSGMRRYLGGMVATAVPCARARRRIPVSPVISLTVAPVS
jgi:hypothetical protein